MATNIAFMKPVIELGARVIHSANPAKLVDEMLTITDNKLRVRSMRDQVHSYNLHQNVKVVGAGKAVFSMAKTIEERLRGHIVSGILSVPLEITDEGQTRRYSDLDVLGKIQVYEGAAGNMPDQASEKAARAICNLVLDLNEDDLLIVLISGGGSALLSLPVPPVTTADLCDLTSRLQRAGASIRQLNLVRKRLEILKGGGLAMLAYPAKVLTLILSDSVDNDIAVIASGPTVITTTTHSQARSVITTLGVTSLPTSIQTLLSKENSKRDQLQKIKPLDKKFLNAEFTITFDHVMNILVGTNQLVLDRLVEDAIAEDCVTTVLATDIAGFAVDEGRRFARLAVYVVKAMIHADLHTRIPEMAIMEIDLIRLGWTKKQLVAAVKLAHESSCSDKPCMLLCGGEAIVQVKGNGLGGRNQEMALSAAIELHALYDQLQGYDVGILCMGTDGQDGPTDMAGAFIHKDVINDATAAGLDAGKYLADNDSYNFFANLYEGAYHVKTGLTGTNVNDVYALYVLKSKTGDSKLSRRSTAYSKQSISAIRTTTTPMGTKRDLLASMPERRASPSLLEQSM